MAVQCEFINLIIPISNIDKVYEGGFQKYKEDNLESFGVIIWHDEFLLREGAMNPMDIEYMVEGWEKLGLKGVIEEEWGEKKWEDLCVVGSYAIRPTLPCGWIDIDPETKSVFFKGKSKGKVVGPNEDRLK